MAEKESNIGDLTRQEVKQERVVSETGPKVTATTVTEDRKETTTLTVSWQGEEEDHVAILGRPSDAFSPDIEPRDNEEVVCYFPVSGRREADEERRQFSHVVDEFRVANRTKQALDNYPGAPDPTGTYKQDTVTVEAGESEGPVSVRGADEDLVVELDTGDETIAWGDEEALGEAYGDEAKTPDWVVVPSARTGVGDEAKGYPATGLPTEPGEATIHTGEEFLRSKTQEVDRGTSRG